MAEDPLIAVILVTVIDMIGYYPTFRKSYLRPYEQMIFVHLIDSVKYAVLLLALESVSLTTSLYPLSIVIASTALSLMIAVRGRQLAA